MDRSVIRIFFTNIVFDEEGTSLFDIISHIRAKSTIRGKRQESPFIKEP